MDDCTQQSQQPQGNDGPNKKRKLLSDILAAGNGSNDLRKRWDETKAADDYGAVLPAGHYVARLVGSDLTNGRTNGTPGVKLTFEVIEGDHAGRRIWHDIWLTDDAMKYTKRDLGKLGVADLEQLDQPLPEGIVCMVKLASRTGNDGSRYNEVRNFDVLRIDAPEPDPFAPLEDKSAEGNAP